MKGESFKLNEKRMGGMTLIELMIVISVLAILVGAAVPSYREYVLRANRSEAIEILLSTGACQERVYTKFNQYDVTRCDIGDLTANGHYAIAMGTTNSNQNYTLTASARLNQAKDSCGDLTLTDQGVRGSSRTTDMAKVADCWRGKRIAGT